MRPIAPWTFLENPLYSSITATLFDPLQNEHVSCQDEQHSTWVKHTRRRAFYLSTVMQL